MPILVFHNSDKAVMQRQHYSCRATPAGFCLWNDDGVVDFGMRSAAVLAWTLRGLFLTSHPWKALWRDSAWLNTGSGAKVYHPQRLLVSIKQP